MVQNHGRSLLIMADSSKSDLFYTLKKRLDEGLELFSAWAISRARGSETAIVKIRMAYIWRIRASFHSIDDNARRQPGLIDLRNVAKVIDQPVYACKELAEPQGTDKLTLEEIDTILRPLLAYWQTISNYLPYVDHYVLYVLLIESLEDAFANVQIRQALED